MRWTLGMSSALRCDFHERIMKADPCSKQAAWLKETLDKVPPRARVSRSSVCTHPLPLMRGAVLSGGPLSIVRL